MNKKTTIALACITMIIIILIIVFMKISENKNKEEPATVKPLRMQQNPHDDGYSEDEKVQLMLPFY